MINFGFTKDQQQLYDSIATFASTQLNDNVVTRDKNQIFPKEEWLKCASKQLHGLCIPLEHGGLGLNAYSTSIALEALAFGCIDGGLVFSLAAQLLSCTVPINLYGSKDQKDYYLPMICSGNKIFSNAITESQSGSDVFSLKTSAVLKDKIYLINGSKTFISNAPNCDYILLYTLTNEDKGFYGGISVFIVDANQKNIHKSKFFDKMGLRSCLMGELQFNNLEVDSSCLLGKEGAGAMIFSKSMQWERALLSAIHIGVMKRILNQSIQYVTSRKINTSTIGNNQSVAHKIAEMHMLLETSQLLVYKAAAMLDNNDCNIGLTSSTTKLYVSNSLNTLCDLALSVFGGNGYLVDEHLERYKRDAIASTIYSGTNDIQKNMIAKFLGM